ncbi:MAG: EamA family transporter [Candidatus Peregrinibacteria bacterium]|nr:EamA family transporter [Candidatus Peregrinibacteria bacterium]
MVTLIAIISVFFSSMAQIFLKLGMNRFGELSTETTLANAWQMLWKIVFNPYLVFGIFLQVLALIVWLYVLKKVEVSYAYPFIALGFVFVLGVGYLFMNETLGYYKLAGIALIIAGIFVLSRQVA